MTDGITITPTYEQGVQVGYKKGIVQGKKDGITEKLQEIINQCNMGLCSALISKICEKELKELMKDE